MDLNWLPKSAHERLFLHDALFNLAFRREGVLTEVIRTVTGLPLTLKEVGTQVKFESLNGRSLILDSLCCGEDGSMWNVEVQTYRHKNPEKRMRFHLDMMSVRALKKGEKWSDLRNVCVIMITDFDPFGLGWSVYRIKPQLDASSPEDKKLLEENADRLERLLDDGRYPIYVNATARDESIISKLCEALTTPEPIYPELFPCICKMKEELLGSNKGRKEMIKLVNKYDKRNWKRGVRRGEKLGEKRGEERGEKRGMEKVERNLEALGARLVADGRTDEALRVLTDKKFRDNLFTAYFPEGLPDD